MLPNNNNAIFTKTRLFNASLRRNLSNFSFPPSRIAKPNFLMDSLKDSAKGTEKSVDGSTKSQAIKTLEPRLIRGFEYSTIYDPFDFSMAKINIDRKNRSKFKLFGNNVNPLDLYTSPEILSQYMSSTGKILHSDVTGLSAKNQRRLAKAIRRAQAIGLLSKTHN